MYKSRETQHKNARTNISTAKHLWIQIAGVVAILAVAIVAIPFTEDLRSNSNYSYGALLIVNLIGGALFMMPGFSWASIATFTIALDNIWLVALVGSTGQAIGEMYSYYLGRTASPLLPKHGRVEKLRMIVKRWGTPAIFILAATPNPIFDLAGAIAGAMKLGWKKFLVISFLGRLIKNLVIAAASMYSLGFLRGLIE